MKNKSKSCLIGLAATVMILFLILGSSAASATPLAIAETKIANSGNASNADIYGNRIVWQDTRSGGNPDIYMYDTATKKETRITKSGSAVNPAIYGNLIAWSDDRNRNGGDIYTYDLSTKKETRITSNGSSSNPDVYGNRIVYQRSIWWAQDCGIFLYDLSNKKVTQIASDNFYEGGMDGDYYDYTLNTNPITYGNRIAWEESGGGMTDTGNILCIYDLSTKKKSTLGSYNYFVSPDIYNDRVVWCNWNSDPKIWTYNFSTMSETEITTSEGVSHPHIYGNRIVWGNLIYDLSTKNETKITTGGSASNPAIYADRVVWQDSRNGGSDIYLGTLSSKPAIVASFLASPVTGKAPLKVQFTDKSSGSPTSWSWNFGDKSVSTTKNPSHKYVKAGKYTVSLTAKNAAGSNTAKKTNYIIVK
ncbi:MAG: PKD domain-containing protein [Methanosarcina sp.]